MALQIWLPLIGTLENKGFKPLTISTVNTTITNDGKLGSVYNFSASTSVIRSAASECNITREHWSVGCWFYQISSSASAHQWMVGIHRGSSASAFQFDLCSYKNNLSLRCASTTRTGPAISLNQWHHGMAVYDGTNLYFYLDGVLSSTTTLPATQDATATTLVIGNRLGNAGAFQGKIQDVRIYDNALSAVEVKEIAQGLIIHYKLEGTNENRLRLIPNSHDATAYQAYAINMTENLVAGETYTMQLWNVDLYHSAKTAANTSASVWWGGGSVNLFAWNASTYFTKTSNTNYHADYLVKTFTVTETQASGSGATNSYLRIYNSPGNATGTRNLEIGRWKLEKGSTATPWIAADADSLENRKAIIDSSGYNNNGTANVNPIYSNVINGGRYSNSMTFNGSTYIRSTQAGMLKDEITVSCWAYEADWSAGYGRTIGCLQSGGWGFDNSTAKRRFYIGTGESSNTYKGATSTSNWTALSAGWHHFVGTYDGFNVKFYVDGELEATTAAYETKTPIYYNTATNIFIGAEAGSNQTTPTTPYFSGNISDVRIYATALSAEDIRILYEVGAKFDDASRIHTYQFLENQNTIKITQQGIVECDELNETTALSLNEDLTIDSNQFIEC